ncbi:MAG: conjugal transfer protein TraF [Gammaproteobacteria bacterium]|nr:conjugal transfer protein TraF [Gammaproteobacteria bacterium]
MKRALTAVSLAVAAAVTHATPLYQPPGSNLTYGAVSNGQSIMSDITNPAAGAAALVQQGENQYRLGIPGSMGIGFEFGKVDDLYDRIDQQAKAFGTTGLENILSNTANIAVIGAEVSAQVDNINSILSDVETNGYAKAFGSINVPLVVAHQGLGGSLVFNAGISAVSRATGLYDRIDFDPLAVNLTPVQTNGDVIIDLPNNTITVNNDSTVLIKASLERYVPGLQPPGDEAQWSYVVCWCSCALLHGGTKPARRALGEIDRYRATI